MKDADSAKTKLRLLLGDEGKLPIIFVGSGLSLRYLGLPNWEQLLQHFAEEAGENYDYILSKYDVGDYPSVATDVATSFNSTWFEAGRYAELRNRHQGQVQSRGMALKFGVSDFIKKRTSCALVEIGEGHSQYLQEIEKLKHVQVEGIITTNYDEFLEYIFPSFVSYVGQRDLLVSEAQFVGEIYKIHGSVERPETLVLDSDDYEDFSKRNPYLVAKLLTLFAERPVIFLGYSIRDAYIGEILRNLAEAVGDEVHDFLSDRLIFVQWNPEEDSEPVVNPFSYYLGGVNIPMTKVQTHSFEWIYEVLSELKRGLSASALRAVKSQVYEAVSAEVVKGGLPKFNVINISDEDKDDVQTIFGFTFGDFDATGVAEIRRVIESPVAAVGYKALGVDDLVEDLIHGGEVSKYSAESVLSDSISNFAATANVPVAKYMREAGWLRDDGGVLKEHEDKRAADILASPIKPSAQVLKLAKRACQSGGSVTLAYVKEKEGGSAIYRRAELPLVADVESFTDEELLEYIRQIYIDIDPQKEISYYRKICAYYDRLKYWPEYRSKRKLEIKAMLASVE